MSNNPIWEGPKRERLGGSGDRSLVSMASNMGDRARTASFDETTGEKQMADVVQRTLPEQKDPSSGNAAAKQRIRRIKELSNGENTRRGKNKGLTRFSEFYRDL